MVIDQGIELRKDDDNRYIADVGVEEEFFLGTLNRSIRATADTVPGDTTVSQCDLGGLRADSPDAVQLICQVRLLSTIPDKAVDLVDAF